MKKIIFFGSVAILLQGCTSWVARIPAYVPEQNDGKSATTHFEVPQGCSVIENAHYTNSVELADKTVVIQLSAEEKKNNCQLLSWGPLFFPIIPNSLIDAGGKSNYWNNRNNPSEITLNVSLKYQATKQIIEATFPELSVIRLSYENGAGQQVDIEGTIQDNWDYVEYIDQHEVPHSLVIDQYSKERIGENKIASFKKLVTLRFRLKDQAPKHFSIHFKTGPKDIDLIFKNNSQLKYEISIAEWLWGGLCGTGKGC